MSQSLDRKNPDTLYVAVDGLTTGLFPVGNSRQAEVRMDFREHAVRVIDSRGAERRFELQPLPLRRLPR